MNVVDLLRRCSERVRYLRRINRPDEADDLEMLLKVVIDPKTKLCICCNGQFVREDTNDWRECMTCGATWDSTIFDDYQSVRIKKA